MLFADKAVARELQQPVAHEPAERVDLRIGREGPMLEAEAPGIDQGHHRHVESTVCGLAHAVGFLEHLVDHGIGLRERARIDARKRALAVEYRQARVYALQLLQNVLAEVGGTFIFNMVRSSENRTFGLAQRTAETDNPHRSSHKEEKENGGKIFAGIGHQKRKMPCRP